MKRISLLLAAACVSLTTLLASCGTSNCCGSHGPGTTLPELKPAKDHSVGVWTNEFQGDPQLAGVTVQQFGECPYDQWRFESKHPCGVFYFFWDGRVVQRQYEPDGTLVSDGNWKNRVNPGDAWWQNVDFTHGSDPEFKHHADPRPKKEA